MNNNYGDPTYWDNRYKLQENTTFEWLEDYESIKPILEDLKLDKSIIKILIPGCGNSELSISMYNDGYTNIENIDISSVVIENMKSKYKDLCPNLNCNTNIYLYS